MWFRPGRFVLPALLCLAATLGTLPAIAAQREAFEAAAYSAIVQSGLIEGALVPDLVAYDRHGVPVKLQGDGEHCLVVVCGCPTCQMFLNNVDSLEDLAADFADQKVKFYYLHKEIVHPELRGMVSPYTLRERVRLVDQSRTELQSQIPWLVDGMGGEILKAFNRIPNIELLISPTGRLLKVRVWSDPQALRRDLASLLELPHLQVKQGEPRRPRHLVADRRSTAPPAKSDFLKPDFMPQITAVPETVDEDVEYFAKLRAELDRPVLKRKRGRLYLRFDLDPIYSVHWSGSTPVEVTLRTAEKPSRILHETSIPRTGPDETRSPVQLLIPIDGATAPRELRVSIRFAVCDAEPKERPSRPRRVEQVFSIRLEETDR